jgi:hypothetical protein
MNDLIYFSLNSLSALDPDLTSSDYVHHPWFTLSSAKSWANHTTSRVHKLNTPWSLADSVSPIPQLNHNNTQFDQVIDGIAERFVQQINSSSRRPYLCFSGGIDSTSILVSLLKTANKDFLQRLVILHNENSVLENAHFYYKYIDKKFETQSIDSFKVTAENYNKIIVVDGEVGNQCMDSQIINLFAYYKQFELLDQAWRTLPDLTVLFPGGNQFHVDLVLESIPLAPVPIETVYDFLWWVNFNFKWDECLLCKVLNFVGGLNNAQSAEFFQHGLYRFYEQPDMQIWSMLTRDHRREKVCTTAKYFSKRYIYEFDHNHLWWANKKEEFSNTKTWYNNSFGTDSQRNNSDLTFNVAPGINMKPYCGQPVVAIDKNWTKYSIADVDTRQALGKILQRYVP